jgi:hypothetical protein
MRTEMEGPDRKISQDLTPASEWQWYTVIFVPSYAKPGGSPDVGLADLNLPATL